MSSQAQSDGPESQGDGSQGDGSQRSRDRCKCSGAEFAEVIRPVVESQGRAWLKYDEAKKVSEARVLPDAIKASHSLLEALHAKSSSLSFVRSEVTTGVGILVEENWQKWKLYEKAKQQEYIEIMVRRVMNICRVVSQAESKSEVKQPPHWVKALPWRVSGAGHESIKIDAKKKHDSESIEPPAAKRPHICLFRGNKKYKDVWPHIQAEQVKLEQTASASLQITVPEYIYGVNQEMKAIFRSSNVNHKNYSKQNHKIEECHLQFRMPREDHDPITAVWPDNHEHVMHDISKKQWARVCAGRESKKSKGLFWEGEVVATHHKLTVQKRQDRNLLISIFEQAKQIDNIFVKSFSKTGEEDEATMIMAASWYVKKIAIPYSVGEIPDKKQLREKRMNLIKNLDIDEIAKNFAEDVDTLSQMGAMAKLVVSQSFVEEKEVDAEAKVAKKETEGKVEKGNKNKKNEVFQKYREG
jgi:hypothetical protein